MKRNLLINYLEERGCHLDFSHEDHDVFTNGIRRQTVPPQSQISDKLVEKICEALGLPIPPELRYQPPQIKDRQLTHEEAEEILKFRGYSTIRWEKFKFTGKFVIHSDRERISVKAAKAKTIRKPYFWIPCAFDGDKGWQYEPVAPSWLKTIRAKRAFIKKHWRETTWPCENGEVSENPIEFITEELASMRSVSDFEDSRDIPKKLKKQAKEKFSDLGLIGTQYLAQALSKGMTLTESKTRQLSEAQIVNGSIPDSKISKVTPEIIELAFRAGRAAERISSYYRGGPFIAQQAIGSVQQQGKGKRIFKKSKFVEWERLAMKAFEEYPNVQANLLLDELIKSHLVEVTSRGRLKWFNDDRLTSYKAGINKINRFRRKYFTSTESS